MNRSSLSKLQARVARPMLACVPALLLAACGGGGGGGSPAPSAAASVVTISSANQKPVAADALTNSTDTNTAQTGSGLVTGVQVDGGTGSGAILRLAGAAQKLAGMVPASLAMATGATTTQTLQCSLGGSLTVSGSVASSTSLSTGDNVTIAANNCVETVNGAQEKMNGSMSITITAGIYNTSVVSYPSHIAMKLVATNFSLVTPTETDASNGDILIDMTQTSATQESLVASGTSLSNSVTTASGSHSWALKNYNQALTVDGSTVTENVTATVETTNSHVGSVSYTVSTPTTISVTSGVYTAGSLKVTGSKSSLLVTVTGNDTFSLQLDADGDGTYESTTNTTIAELKTFL